MAAPSAVAIAVDHQPWFAGRAAVPGHGSVVVTASAGRSRVTRAFASSPLRLLTPGNHGRASWIFTSTFGGGLVGGDAVCLGIDVGEGANAYLSTQSATKVYRSVAGTSAELRAMVGAGATLIVAPDPVICFAGSSYRQRQHVDLHAGANLVLVDWLSSGRHAAGERWQFDRYDSRLVVQRHGRTIVHDALLLSPEQGSLVERMGRFDALLVVVVVGPALATASRDLLARVEGMPVERRGRSIVSASRIGDGTEGGCVLRIAGMSVEDTGATLRALLGFVPGLLGDDPWSRKW